MRLALLVRMMGLDPSNVSNVGGGATLKDYVHHS